MAAFEGELLAKEGAEGFYAMGIAPALAGELRAPISDPGKRKQAEKRVPVSISSGRPFREVDQLLWSIERRSVLAGA
jgi:hypothetical protein